MKESMKKSLLFLLTLCITVGMVPLTLPVMAGDGVQNVWYVAYGGTGDGSSYDSPLGSLGDAVRAINAAGLTAGDTATVYISKRVFGNGMYTQQPLSWKSEEDSLFVSFSDVVTHTATVIFTSDPHDEGYDASDYTKQTKVAIRNAYNNTGVNLVTRGPSVYKDLVILDSWNNARYFKDVCFSGNDAELDNVTFLTLNGSGEFIQKAFSVYSGSNRSSGSFGGGGTAVIHNASGLKDYCVGSLGHAAGHDLTFSEDVTVILNGGTLAGMYFSAAYDGQVNTFNKNVNIVVNNGASVTNMTGASLSSYTQPVLNGALQILLNHGSTVKTMDFLPQTGGGLDTPVYVLSSASSELSLNVTETAGTFAVSGSGIAYVQSADKNAVYYGSETLTVPEGRYTVKVAASKEELLAAVETPEASGYKTFDGWSDDGAGTVTARWKNDIPTYYVSSDGSDTNDGLSALTPFASFKKATEMAAQGDILVYIMGEFTLSSNDTTAHTSTVTVKGYDETAVLRSADGNGVGFGGPAALKNITYTRGTNAYMVTNGYDITFDTGFTASASSDWYVFGGKQGCSATPGFDVTVKDGAFTGEFVLGGMMPASGHHVTGDVTLSVSGGTIGKVKLGSSGWGACGGTTFDRNVLIDADGGQISTISAVSSGNGSPTVITGALQILLNGGMTTTLDSSLDEVSVGSRYIVRSGEGGTVMPVYDSDGNLVPGKVIVTIHQEGDAATLIHGSSRVFLEENAEVTLEEGITEIVYGEKQLEKGTTIPMTWKAMDKGYITLIFDDNNTSLPGFYNIITGEYDMPICAAVPSATLKNNNAILHEIQNHGGEILSHTRDHLVLNTSIPWETVDYQLGQSWRELTADGFNVHGIILAGGIGQDQTESYRAQIEGFTNKYYLYSDKYGVSTQYWKQRNWFSGRSVEELKAIIDQQIENKTWEVIYAHNFTECSEETLRAVLDYLAEKKAEGLVDVVTYRYMHETFGDWQGDVDFGDTTYTVEFYGSDNSTYLGKCVAVRGTEAILANPLEVKEGYTMTGWSQSVEQVTGNMKVYALCTDEEGNAVSQSVPSVVTSRKVYYVDAVNGSDDNTGVSEENAFVSINAAVSAAGSSDFDVVIVGTYTLPTTVSSHDGVMTVYGADAEAVLATGDGMGYYLGGPVVIRDICFKNGTYSYVYTRGDKVILGENITTSGSHQIITGSYRNQVTQSSDFSVYSGSYGQLTVGEIATADTHTIPGDMKVQIFGGSVSDLILGNTGWSSDHKDVVYEGNVLLRVDGGKVSTVRASLNNYLAVFHGALEVIFNNSTSATLDSSFTAAEATGGKYVIYSTGGGYVDFAYDTEGNTLPGTFELTVPENCYAKIQNGTEVQYVLQTDRVALLPGTSTITYESMENLGKVICVTDDNGEKSFYLPQDTVTLTRGGTVHFPENMEQEGKLFAGWYADAAFSEPVAQDSFLTPGTLYARWIALDARDLYLEGVQVRISGPLGLRFISNLTPSLRSTLITLHSDNAVLNPENASFNATDGIGYGMVLLPEVYLGENALVKNGSCSYNGKEYVPKTVPARKTYEITADFDRYTAVLVGITDENLSRRYTARPYVTYTDASGMTHTVYGVPYTASLYKIARELYENGAIEEAEEQREEILTYLYENILTKNDGVQNPLANTYRALVNDKKLTVGYLGGSITNGYSAAKKVNENGTVSSSGGDILLSYVNRTTTWLKEKYPDAEIEAVNAGVSDTATNLGIYRLESQLMNEEGHDMPDLVFVEFTSNDWVYDGCISQSRKDLRRQAESLVRLIYERNPYADIVFVFTARSETASSRREYIEIADAYGIPYVDMGIPLQQKMTRRGYSNESSGSYYYTVDNLHPSTTGYGVYFEQIQTALTPYLDTEVYFVDKADHTAALPQPLSRSLWENPVILPTSSFTVTGNVTKEGGLTTTLYGLSQTTSGAVSVTPDSIRITEDGTKVSFSFTGTTAALLLGMNNSGINADYRVDGKDLKHITIDTDLLSFQKYDHTQLFVLEQELAYGTHTIELTFHATSDGQVNVRLGGAAAAGADNHLDKLIALTIDDGPRVASSNAILNVLEKYGAHATFFSVGDNIKSSTYPVMERMLALDCEIGNHGNGWKAMSGMTAEQLTEDYNTVQNKVYAAVGVYPKVFRAPGLTVSQTMYDTIPLPFMGGRLGISDWDESVGLEERITALRNNMVDGRVVLIHDLELNAEALDTVLPEMIAEGFTVVTVSELYTLRGYRPTAAAGIQYSQFDK